MIHPVVFENCGIDPESGRASRSAWASSASRCFATASPNIKLLFENDPRFLAQF